MGVEKDENFLARERMSAEEEEVVEDAMVEVVGEVVRGRPVRLERR